MGANVFDAIDFIQHGHPQPLLDCKAFPFLCNRNGRGVQASSPQGTLIELAGEDPGREAGTRYRDIRHQPREVMPDLAPPYRITLFDFGQQEVCYQPLPATRENALAFGMTLLKNGECLRFDYPNLVMTEYRYGKWAGHQSPYLGPGRSGELLQINPTDLEYHDFPHVFFSLDEVPLVISVARWRPYVNEIALADLWIQPGDAIVLPPKVKPAEPPPGMPYENRRRIILDLHGNRNAALACWSVGNKATLTTTTILGTEEVMRADATKPHYHEEPAATRHASRPLIGSPTATPQAKA